MVQQGSLGILVDGEMFLERGPAAAAPEQFLHLLVAFYDERVQAAQVARLLAELRYVQDGFELRPAFH